MRCLFVIVEAGVCRIENLPNVSLDVFADASGKVLFQNGGSVTQPLARIVCEDFTCRLTPSGKQGVRWRGAPLTRQATLSDGDLVEMAGAFIWFRRLPAIPVFRNVPCSEIPLKGVNRLAFGRSPDGAVPGEDFVLLDPDDRMISRRHVSIQRKDGDFFATDESPTGTFLNGSRSATGSKLAATALNSPGFR